MLDVSPLTATPKSSTRSRFVKTPRGLSAIKRPGLDLCVWRRTLPDDLSAWCRRLVRTTALAVDERGVTADEVDFERYLADVPQGEMKDLWVADLNQVLGVYRRVVGDVPLRVQISTIDSRKCPRFHIDNVGLRLLCTYAGAGTEWIDERQLDREHLRVCTVDHAPVKQGGAVEHLLPFDVALMKGTAFPGNGRFGQVHRSPAVAGAARLVFTLDTHFPPSR
jgi:hypothetical protein